MPVVNGRGDGRTQFRLSGYELLKTDKCITYKAPQKGWACHPPKNRRVLMAFVVFNRLALRCEANPMVMDTSHAMPISKSGAQPKWVARSGILRDGGQSMG